MKTTMMIEQEVTVETKRGRYLWQAARFVRQMKAFNCEVRVAADEDTEVDGKSVLALLALESWKRSKLHIRFEGRDAMAAAKEFEHLRATLPNEFRPIDSSRGQTHRTTQSWSDRNQQRRRRYVQQRAAGRCCAGVGRAQRP